MWTVLILLNLAALHCAVSTSPPSPTSVNFSSVNLRNMLKWFPGKGTPDDTCFTVQYAIYGDSVEGSRRVHWRAVRQCTEIVQCWCDLSNETWDLEQGYHARVRAVSRRASSKWASTWRRFDPNLDTSIGPPLVSVDIKANSAVITLKGPMRYQPNNHTPAVSMATLYPQMMYNLSIHNARRGQTSHFSVVSSLYKYHLMEYDTEYCFSAKARFLSMPIHCQSSVWYCIITPPDPATGQLQKVLVGIVVPSVCMCMLLVVGYLLYHYLTGKGQESPYILNLPTFHQPPLTFPPEYLKPILITVIKPSDIKSSMSDAAFSKRWIANPPPSYASQRPEAPPEPEEPWDDLSVDYGCIGIAPKIDVRGVEEERERRHDGGRDGNNLKGEHQKDSYEKKEWRVEVSHSAGVCAPQAKSYLTETSTLIQARACSQVNSVLLTQTQFPPTNPQTGPFHIPLNLQTKKEGGMGEEMEGKVRVGADGKIDGGVEEGSESERVPLLSAYASQNIKDMPTSHADQSDFLPDEYGALRLATAREIEEDDYEEDGAICINWDPKTRKILLPEMVMESNKEGGLDGSMQGEKGRENGMGGEEEEVYVTKGALRLENVYVRQASEEEAEAQREVERGGETGCEADDILTKWNLVISMDQ